MSALTPDPYSFMLPFYDRWAAHMGADIEFYVEQARAARGPVMELGAGNGRVSIPIARAGVEVIAVDVSDAMLTESARRAAAAGLADRIRFVRGDMRTFVPDEPVELVIIPARSFLHNLTTEDQLATLRAVRASLRPGGRLVMNFFTPDPERIVQLHDRPALQTEYTDERGRRCEVWATSTYELATQRVALRAELRVFDDERLVASSHDTLHLRLVYRYEMEHLFARSGFEVETLYGGFARKSYGPGADEMVWVAIPRADA